VVNLPQMECANDEAILAFVTGSLDPTRRREIEIHLDSCTECLELITVIGKTSLAEGDQRTRVR
jgi:anti-sigma factor RsiW